MKRECKVGLVAVSGCQRHLPYLPIGSSRPMRFVAVFAYSGPKKNRKIPHYISWCLGAFRPPGKGLELNRGLE